MKNKNRKFSSGTSKVIPLDSRKYTIETLLVLLLILLVASTTSFQTVANEEKVRIGFFSDIHFDVTKRPDTEFGGVEVDQRGKVNYEIPVQAKATIESIKPDLLFDSGDMTAHSKDEDFRAYQHWKQSIDVPIHPVMGNHDREHKQSKPYGTGFYSICGYNSATRVLKMGNLVFILISEDHHYEFHELDAAISAQKFQWIEQQLRRYSQNKNNIFIIEHYPIKNTVAWSDFFYGLGGYYWFGTAGWFDWWWKPWERTSEKWKQLLEEYEEDIVAHISGHIHIPYGWRDVSNDREIYGYGDGDHKVENIGQFVSGKQINDSNRDRLPYQLPEVNFLNIRAIDYKHQVANRFDPSSALYYAVFSQGSEEFNLKAVDIVTGEMLGNYRVNVDHPIDLGRGKLHFMSSDLGIRSKEKTVEITENDWFDVHEGKSGWVTFQKEWSERINVSGVNVIATHGRHSRIHYKGSRDGGKSWDDWTTQPPQNVNVLQVQICFWAEEDRDMKVHDVRVEISRGKSQD